MVEYRNVVQRMQQQSEQCGNGETVNAGGLNPTYFPVRIRVPAPRTLSSVVEHGAFNSRVDGSNPSAFTKFNQDGSRAADVVDDRDHFWSRVERMVRLELDAEKRCRSHLRRHRVVARGGRIRG